MYTYIDPSGHPDVTALERFALGFGLSDQRVAEIADHVELCNGCADTLKEFDILRPSPS
jgi:hypothetical protein